jgi:beta-N-acetylhexosaminidase
MAARHGDTVIAGRRRSTALSVLGIAGAVSVAACGPAHLPGARRASSALASPASSGRSQFPKPSLPAPATSSAVASPTVIHPSSPSPQTCTTVGVLQEWNLARLAEQTVVVPVQEDDVASVASEVSAGAGGVILFGGYAPSDLGPELAALTRLAPGRVAPFVMADEEGGVVQRLANLVGSLPSAREMAATMTAGQVENLVRLVGERMHVAGVTMDLAPVLDLDAGSGPNASDADGTRSFSLDPTLATRDGLAFADGLLAAGVIPVVKHFPGLGRATGNTDLEPAQTQPWPALERAGILPFEVAIRAGMPAVMVSNASVPGLTSLPASLSSAVITGVLRDRLGFTGLVLTDSLSAIAVSDAGYPVPRAAVAALAAGADMVMFNGGDPQTTAGQTEETVSAITAAAQDGFLARTRLINAVVHILAAKHINLCA